VLPTKGRFFRGAMSTIISRALNDLEIKPLPSRRCFSIMSECVRARGGGGVQEAQILSHSTLCKGKGGQENGAEQGRGRGFKRGSGRGNAGGGCRNGKLRKYGGGMAIVKG